MDFPCICREASSCCSGALHAAASHGLRVRISKHRHSMTAAALTQLGYLTSLKPENAAVMQAWAHGISVGTVNSRKRVEEGGETLTTAGRKGFIGGAGPNGGAAGRGVEANLSR